MDIVIKIMKYFLTTFFILFLVTAVFSFTAMGHYTKDSKMTDNCAIPIFGSSICANDTLNMVVHHISAYQSFSQVGINYFEMNFLLLLLSLFLAGVFLLLRFLLNLRLKYFLSFIFSRLHFENIGRNTNHKVLNWLSLLENSPAL